MYFAGLNPPQGRAAKREKTLQIQQKISETLNAAGNSKRRLGKAERERIKRVFGRRLNYLCARAQSRKTSKKNDASYNG